MQKVSALEEVAAVLNAHGLEECVRELTGLMAEFKRDQLVYCIHCRGSFLAGDVAFDRELGYLVCPNAGCDGTSEDWAAEDWQRPWEPGTAGS